MVTVLILSFIIAINIAINAIHMVYINKNPNRCILHRIIYEEIHTDDKIQNLVILLVCIFWFNLLYVLFWILDPDFVRIEDCD